MKRALLGAKIFCGEKFFNNHAVLTNNENITSIVKEENIPSDFNKTKLNSGIIAPGFIDLQVNGGGGELFNDNPSVTNLEKITKAHQFFGTTSILPTVISDHIDVLKNCINIIDSAIKNNHAILGIHIEGPFFNNKYRGVHQDKHIKKPDKEYMALLATLTNYRTLLTLAPECVDPQQLKQIYNLGIKIFAGHTGGSYEELKQAIDNGVVGFTHLFNAMSQISPREPSVVGAALHFDNTFASIIADLRHVHPALVQLAYRQKPKGKLFFVSDSMSTINSKPEFNLYGETIIEKNGALTNSENTLAGSCITQIDAVKNAYQKCNIPLNEALAMASKYPANFFDVHHYLGSLKPKYKADIVHFDDNFNVLNVWFRGQHINREKTCE